jgi:hypothetical protein
MKEDVLRLNGKIEGLIASRDILKSKLEKFELKVDYDTELKKLLPSEESIAKYRELEKITEQKFHLNAAILKNMKGLPGEEDQRREVQRLKMEFKNIKQLLSKVDQTIFSFKFNFERQIENIRAELASTNNEIDQAIKARNKAEERAA